MIDCQLLLRKQEAPGWLLNMQSLAQGKRQLQCLQRLDPATPLTGRSHLPSQACLLDSTRACRGASGRLAERVLIYDPKKGDRGQGSLVLRQQGEITPTA